MMKPLIRGGKFLGTFFETTRAYFFFGSNALGKEHLPSEFPNVSFCLLKQVHGERIVHGSPKEIIEADGHFTGTPSQGLVIQTADCIPLLLANHSQVCGLHAGWRGTAAGIVAKSKSCFMEAPDVAVIGPHIRTANFEIGRDVMAQLLKTIPGATNREQFLEPHKDPAKVYFNLTALLKLHLLLTYPEIQIFDGGEDTFTSARYHSFRRDKTGAGRQYSFVMLKA